MTDSTPSPLPSSNDYQDEKPPTTPFQLPSLMIGGAVFSHHYNSDVEKLETEEIISRAIDAGANAIDTSPYYGASESTLGTALSHLRPTHPRSSYTLISKCGRLTASTFNYTRAHIRHSIHRSLTRLRTSYLDAALLHDVDFVSAPEVLTGMTELLALKSQGLIRAVGISGYALDVLLRHAAAVRQSCGKNVDVVFSYCHYTLHNDELAVYAPRLRALGVAAVVNGSPLAMGLLRAEGPPEWHPAGRELKEACRRAAGVARERFGRGLAEVAVRFGVGFEGTTCVGCSTVGELEGALEAWRVVRERRARGEGDGEDEEVFEVLKGVLRGEWGMTWAVPPVGWVREESDEME